MHQKSIVWVGDYKISKVRHAYMAYFSEVYLGLSTASKSFF
jgi:hypothetical protein